MPARHKIAMLVALLTLCAGVVLAVSSRPQIREGHSVQPVPQAPHHVPRTPHQQAPREIFAALNLIDAEIDHALTTWKQPRSELTYQTQFDSFDLAHEHVERLRMQAQSGRGPSRPDQGWVRAVRRDVQQLLPPGATLAR